MFNNFIRYDFIRASAQTLTIFMNKPMLPKTSLAANDAAKELKQHHHAKIIKCLEKHPEGLIYEDIATETKLEKVAVARRLNELERTFIVVKPGNTKNTSTGRKAMVYRLKSLLDFSKALTQKSLF